MDLENKKPVLIVIAGPNGSGKTSVTSKILVSAFFRWHNSQAIC